MKTNDKLLRQPVTDQPDWTGQILRARIKRAYHDHCDLELLSPEDDRVVARGRLYQSESLAWKDARLLADIPHYQEGESLAAVFAKHLRHEQGQGLWYVNERWALHNPWVDLPIAEGDTVEGVVTRRIAAARNDELAGYLIQLNIETRLRTNASDSIETTERLQPDIEVFLPIEELPWSDGSLGLQADSANTERMCLEIGDLIQAMVLKINFPPRHPWVSLIRLINHRDAEADREFKHRDAMARWRFRRLLGNAPAGMPEDRPSPEFSSDERPYANRRLLLVDDDGEAMASLAELLVLMGATVERVLVKPNGFSQAVSAVTEQLSESRFDLALIDNNLPGRDLGQILIERVETQLGSANQSRLVLLTANAIKTDSADIAAILRPKGVSSMAHRPITHTVLQRLLAGEEIWEAYNSLENKDAPQSPMMTAHTSIQQGLDLIAQQTGVSFAVLLKAQQHIEAGEMFSSGPVPFRREQYAEALAKTDLHLFVEDRITQLTITDQERGNEYLRLGGTGSAHWQVIASASERWIFGLGHVSDVNIQVPMPLWRTTLAAILEAQAWRNGAEHVSSFVQLGLAHHGLSHEVINLEDEIGNLLDSLRRWLSKQPSGIKLEGKTRDYINNKIAALSRNTLDLLDFSKWQLRGHALRQQKVFLPDAVETIKRIVESECKESEVALYIANSPPLALPVANAALVLPTVNLLINAAKHHYRSENRRVELLFDCEQTGSCQFLVLDVRDNGPGLEQASLKRLWQPGYSSASDVEQRHGIGLWLSRQLVNEAGGSLVLHENWRSLGACFRMRFPIHLG